jgi:hypothetical protein
MTWLLILTFIAPDGQASQHVAGQMVDQDTCNVAGAGMEIVLQAANPGLDIAWTCLPSAPEVGA